MKKSEVLNKALRKDGELIFIVSPSFLNALFARLRLTPVN